MATKKSTQAVELRMRMNLFRSKTCPQKEVTRLLRNGALLTHVREHIAQFGESKTGEYNVKVSASGHVTVGGVDEKATAAGA
jgi:hypothetical protein